MSNYSKTTDFEAKDSLPTGDSGKIIRGSEFETEFDAISTAIATKADTAGPTFTGTLTFETISDGTINVTAFVDEDNMASNSATLVPTQQSVKAYVDSQLTAQDLDFQADSGGALSIDLDSETMTFTGGTGIDTSGSGNAVTFAIDSTVATLTGTQTLTNKTLTSPDVNTPDIDGGTIDNTVIGGSTAAAGSFTSLSATGNITVGGTVDGRDVATDGSKLDGIEASATADQTASEIRTLVESASDSNVFTDADHSKLDGIEASADVTDATNVTAAGALMDSELTSIASVKALNQGVATSDSPTFAAVTVNGNVEFDGLSGTGSVTVTDILDQDDMSGNSATALATQQSIKAYVDSQVATADTLSEVLANGNTTGGTNIVFGDSSGASDDRLIFGAGSDLQIYHDGSASFISDQGTGNLKILATDLQVRNAGDSGTLLTAVDGGAVTLKFNSNTKLATTNTGIDVTGTAVTDGLTVESTGATFFNATVDAGTGLTTLKSTNNSTGGSLKIQTGGNDRFQISAGGDISFFEDTGTTAKLFFDASAESLGIGTTSPNFLLDVEGSGSLFRINATSGDATAQFSVANTTSLNTINFGDSGSTTSGQILYRHNGDSMAFNVGGAEAIRILDGGNVGIGTSSPATLLHVNSSTTTSQIRVTNSTGTSGFDFQTSGNAAYVYNRNNGPMIFGTNSIERVRIDASGNVGIGTSTVTDFSGTVLQVHASSGSAARIKLTTATSGTATSDGGSITFDTSNNLSLLNRESSALTLGTSALERMRIDSSGTAIFKGGTQDNAIQIWESGSEIARIGPASGALRFLVGSTTTPRMIIDSSGNLLVGQTAQVSPGFGNTQTGSGIRSNGNASFSRSGNSTQPTLMLNKNTNDGVIASFQKDGATVGSIGTLNSNTYFGNGAVTLLPFDSLNAILPRGTAGAQRDAAIGLGNSSNRFKDLHLSGTSHIGSNLTLLPSGSNSEIKNASGVLYYKSGQHNFQNAAGTTEYARLDSSGNFLVGTTSASIAATNNTGAVIVANGASQFSRDGGHTLDINRAQDGEIVRFRSAGNAEGSISISGSTTSYNTSSDQRLKDNIVDAPSASDDIDAIQVRSFDWKADGSHQKYGMVAQELQSVAPDAVTGDADSDEMMGVDYSKLVPMMMKEIQSLRARVAQLEGVN